MKKKKMLVAGILIGLIIGALAIVLIWKINQLTKQHRVNRYRMSDMEEMQNLSKLHNLLRRYYASEHHSEIYKNNSDRS